MIFMPDCPKCCMILRFPEKNTTSMTAHLAYPGTPKAPPAYSPRQLSLTPSRPALQTSAPWSGCSW